MNRLPISPAASAVLRCLVARSGSSRDRILLTDVKSVDWHSLTFTGERHQLQLRSTGPDAHQAVERMCDALEDVEFSIPGVIVADIAVTADPRRSIDGSVTLTIEALTVAAD